MKRLTYISKFARHLTPEHIEVLGASAAAKNRGAGITGVLFSLNGMFFQILEGAEADVDALFASILLDRRHRDVVCLTSENNIDGRIFPDWSMKTINLDNTDEQLLEPVKVLLQRLAETHKIIERYTQPSVLNILTQGLNPLWVRPQRVTRIVMFSDIAGFTSLGERYDVEEIVSFVNRYFEICAYDIVSHGGEVAKYIGDCVMALFPADAADGALDTALAILEHAAAVREQAPPGALEAMLHCGVGIARGEVIEGNIGSSIKIDYTVVGDAVNCAQRLEDLTRILPCRLAFSRELRDAVRQPRPFRSLGHYPVKGRQASMDVYTLDDPLVTGSLVQSF